MKLDTSSRRQPARIPGEAGIWVVVMGDLFIFALLFGTVAYYWMDDPAVFHAAQSHMNQLSGLANTLVLLTSSLFVVLGLEAARESRPTAPRWLTGAALLGLAFVAIKVLEYREKVSEGWLPDTNMFFMLYFVLTGIHLLHVAIGLLALAFMRGAVTPRVDGAADELRLVECGAIFWHLVDLLWVFLFAIFYMHS